MINFASNLNKMINAGLGGPLDPPRTEVAVGHRVIYTEVSGDVVNFKTNVAAPVKNLRVTMEPIQDLHGQDAPYPAGGGANLFDKESAINGYYISNSNGNEVSSSGAVATDFIPVKPSTSYYIINDANSGLWGAWYDANKVFIRGITGKGVVTSPDGAAYMRYTVKNGDASSGSIDTFAINYPSTATSYAPYSNICSITGRESVTVTRSGENLFDETAYNGQSATIQLGQTVYGGTVDVTKGRVLIEWENIASYNGETLPGEWISDRDVYAPGATPTIGAQVCYKLAEPLTIQLTPAQLNTLDGQNNVWSDAGDISLEYPYYEETEGY